MTIKEIYDLAVKRGIEADFREDKDIKATQKRYKEQYDKMDKKEKEFFDVEKLKNPFSDTRILFGNPDKKVKKILVGIDIDGDEMLLAKELKNIDLVVSHHPRGEALAGLDDIMQLQADVLHMYGVQINIAEKLLRKRIQEVARGVSSVNHNRVVDIAKYLNIPLMSIHTPCDNLAARFVDQKIKKDKPFLVGDLINSLSEVPEYREASKMKAGPKIFVGDKENRTGKIVITEMTGGTEGSPEIYEKLAQAGAGTVVGMHISEKHRE